MSKARLLATVFALVLLAGLVSAVFSVKAAILATPVFSTPASMAATAPATIPTAPATTPVVTPTAPSAFHFAWPTPNQAFRDGADISAWVQDTGTGDPHSGLFGCVRDDGHRFHEGIDIKAVERDRKGVPQDSIFAVMDGRVEYINSKPGNSSYGDYIVIEHLSADVPVYTLYAHLASIAPGLKAGQDVAAGAVIARLGHSGTENIPLERAHLHFEIGLRLTNQFQPWYDSKKFGSPNQHGIYNGYNLLGSDPKAFFDAVRSGKFKSFAQFIRAIPTAFTLRITTTRVPDFVARYPALLAKPVPLAGVAGWDVAFTWYGMPTLLTPLPAGTPGLGRPGSVALVSYDRAQFTGCTCRDTLLFPDNKNAPPRIGVYLDDNIKMLFGFK